MGTPDTDSTHTKGGHILFRVNLDLGTNFLINSWSIPVDLPASKGGLLFY
jgi:hypothetical protein